MQRKQIADLPILDFLAQLERGDIVSTYKSNGPGSVNGVMTFRPRLGGVWIGAAHSVMHAMEGVTSEKLALAKMKSLVSRGLVSGCCCGCQGDFGLTVKGHAHLSELSQTA